MLSERQLEKILEVFRQRMQGVTEAYLKKMGQHLRDIGTLTPSDINRLIEFKRLNYNLEVIKREIAKAANACIKDVDAVFEAVAESDARFAADAFSADHTPLIKDNPALERILKAQAKITKQQLVNLSQTTLISESYKTAVDLAVQSVQAGVTDYNSAIRKAMKAAAADGLRVKYPSGLSRRLDSAVRMNILDGVRAINQDILYQVGKEFDADGVEISAHMLCAEDHVMYQGKQMPIKEFERLQNVILDRPFGMWNCRHTWHYILLGISEPRYTQEELNSFRRNSRERITIDGVTKSRYEWTQEQRRIETAVRYQKDIAVAAKASGDIVARRECAYMIRELDKRYAEISEAAGLIEKRERMKVSGFNKVKPADELKNAQKPVIIRLPDIVVIPSLGAKSMNDDILDLVTGERFKLVPGTRIKNIVVFAGKGVKKPYEKAYLYAEDLGGNVEDWQHVKGIGYVDYYGEERKANIHWSRCEGIGDTDKFVKEWLDED